MRKSSWRTENCALTPLDVSQRQGAAGFQNRYRNERKDASKLSCAGGRSMEHGATEGKQATDVPGGALQPEGPAIVKGLGFSLGD